MAVHVVRLGSPRAPGEGLRLGTVRRPPRGVRKEDFARRDFYDVWLPELAPSAQLLSWVQHQPPGAQRWARFEREYRREMGDPVPQRLIGLLAAMSTQGNFAVGCYCMDEAQCHRSILRGLLAKGGAVLADEGPPHDC